MLDGIKLRELKTKLYKVSRRKFIYATERILGDGVTVKGAIKKIYSTMQRLPKAAIKKWKKYLQGLKYNHSSINCEVPNCLTACQEFPSGEQETLLKEYLEEVTRSIDAYKTLSKDSRIFPRKL